MNQPSSISLGRQPDDGTLQLVYSYRSLALPVELIVKIAQNLEATGHRHTISLFSRASKRLHALITPILYRTITLTTQNARQLLPSLTYLDDPTNPQTEIDQEALHYWALEALLNGKISRWDTTGKIMMKMLESGIDCAQGTAKSVIAAQRKMHIELRRVDQRSIDEYDDDSQLREMPLAEDTIRPMFTDATRISNLRHVETLFIREYPREEHHDHMIGYHGLQTYAEALPRALHHRIMPKLKAICLAENLERFAEEVIDDLSELRRFAGADQHREAAFARVTSILSRRREILSGVLCVFRLEAGINICIHDTPKTWPLRNNKCCLDFMCNIGPIASLTLHGSQSASCSFTCQATNEAIGLRYMLGSMELGEYALEHMY